MAILNLEGYEQREILDPKVPQVLKEKFENSVGVCIRFECLKLSGSEYTLVNPAGVALSLEEYLKTEFGGSSVDPNIPSRNQPPLGFGTAFVVGDNFKLMASAGHVVMNDSRTDIDDHIKKNGFYVVFGWQLRQNSWPTSFPLSMVYHVEAKGIMVTQGSGPDFCFFRAKETLDEKIKPLKFLEPRSTAPKAEDSVVTAGFPRGVPVKFAKGVIKTYPGSAWEGMRYAASVDKGCSGSPIFAFDNGQTVGDVLGIVIRGVMSDYRRDTSGKVVRVVLDGAIPGEWEDGQRIEAIRWCISSNAKVELFLDFPTNEDTVATNIKVTINGGNNTAFELERFVVRYTPDQILLPPFDISGQLHDKKILPVDVPGISFQVVPDNNSPGLEIKLLSMRLRISGPDHKEGDAYFERYWSDDGTGYVNQNETSIRFPRAI
ncbi:hypothetical protein MVEN_02251400 [Mycena venus]|uniref:Serine protease n=1 Tax=Mycena venus TaxID=2733690 RepID=A0A8H6X5T2_9AGAR|nr:hypothetical protein MVEN_02251400 [Mycena venus]